MCLSHNPSRNQDCSLPRAPSFETKWHEHRLRTGGDGGADPPVPVRFTFVVPGISNSGAVAWETTSLATDDPGKADDDSFPPPPRRPAVPERTRSRDGAAVPRPVPRGSSSVLKFAQLCHLLACSMRSLGGASSSAPRRNNPGYPLKSRPAEWASPNISARICPEARREPLTGRDRQSRHR